MLPYSGLRSPGRATKEGEPHIHVRLQEEAAPMFAFATLAVVVAFIGVVIFIPSPRPTARLVKILRAWRRRS